MRNIESAPTYRLVQNGFYFSLRTEMKTCRPEPDLMILLGACLCLYGCPTAAFAKVRPVRVRSGLEILRLIPDNTHFAHLVEAVCTGLSVERFDFGVP